MHLWRSKDGSQDKPFMSATEARAYAAIHGGTVVTTWQKET